MSLAQPKLSTSVKQAFGIAKKANEIRRFQRVQVSVLGRFMLENRKEYPCQIVNMSPGGAAVIAPTTGNIGERVIAYMDHIGRIEGVISRLFPGGFAMDLVASPKKRDKLASQLTWLANKNIRNMPEDRRHDRLESKPTSTSLTMSDGRSYDCRLIDLSLSGAAVAIAVRPAIGTAATLGMMRCRVVRHLDNGIALEFAHLQDAQTLKEQFGIESTS